ncbi:MAG: hypothetical protein EOM24_04735 [Chloroflexia bacterium]|nr:hypothetical protein [Chloroflexia bacterium]
MSKPTVDIHGRRYVDLQCGGEVLEHNFVCEEHSVHSKLTRLADKSWLCQVKHYGHSLDEQVFSEARCTAFGNDEFEADYKAFTALGWTPEYDADGDIVHCADAVKP